MHLRFVILRHHLPAELPRSSHWDLMLEWTGVLLTWSLDQLPAAAQVQEARQLSHHRLAYLEYEGPISGNRGEVTRWDAGVYRWLTEMPGSPDDIPDTLRCHLLGQRLRGTLSLVREGDPCWQVSWQPDAT